MGRKLLIAILSVTFVIECIYPIGGFLFPEKVLDAFKVQVSADTLFLTYVLAWCLLFVAIICGLALKGAIKSERMGLILSYALGIWWLGIGVGLFLQYDRVLNLFLDGLKGLLLIGAAYLTQKQSSIKLGRLTSIN